MLLTIGSVASPPLLVAAFVWAAREGDLSRPRQRLFIASLLASTLAYVSHFVLAHFLRTSHLTPWDRADLIVGVGGLMFLAALVGVVGSSFGRNYGRICGMVASVLVGMLWWLTGIVTPQV